MLVGAVGDVLEGETESGLVVTALEGLATLVRESLDIAERNGGELRGEELGGEVVVRVEGVNVDEAVVDVCHCGAREGL